jgi:hypothetical protein
MSPTSQTIPPSLFLDVDGAMLSQDFTHFCKNEGQNFRYSDKAACRKYINLLEKLCDDNSIFNRVDKLHKKNPEDWTPHQTSALNNVDSHISRLMKRAENKCKKWNSKGHMTSEELQLATSRSSYWHYLKKSLLPTRNIKQETIHRKRKFAKIPNHPPLTKQVVQAEHTAAQATLKSIRENSAEYR